MPLDPPAAFSDGVDLSDTDRSPDRGSDRGAGPTGRRDHEERERARQLAALVRKYV